ncbi:MAG: nucleotide exchange factor GrpE [Thaumarchaeota archaeon]|jgi:molecular chaperone GrpE|nr:nucleotide exchange factor GrpE [Nitrososphaerota archaeon]MBT5842236.1 nucleotide exchange factor GrpE [Nitrososphaerota archaeon]MBT6469122.1 nucleotide exchange factor GrpE [Nitrososphaerota archaeon]
MSNESDEIPVNVISENQDELNTADSVIESEKILEINDHVDESDKSLSNIEDLTKLLNLEKQKVVESDEKLKRVFADLQNIDRKTKSDIENGVNTKVDEFMLDFLKIYDDFIRAKEVFSENKIDVTGLESILKNMDSLLKKYQVIPIDSLGEIFDPNYHEAISITTDSDLDDNTITKEIRKGYISQKRVIRPTLVEISKKG